MTIRRDPNYMSDFAASPRKALSDTANRAGGWMRHGPLSRLTPSFDVALFLLLSAAWSRRVPKALRERLT
jgi:hypothetical protein